MTNGRSGANEKCSQINWVKLIIRCLERSVYQRAAVCFQSGTTASKEEFQEDLSSVVLRTRKKLSSVGNSDTDL